MSTERISIAALVFVAVLFVLALAPVSEADSVTYTFTGINNSLNNDQLSVAFTYTAPGFIPPTPVGEVISLFASQLDSCTNCQVSSTVPAVFLSSWGGVGFNDVLNYSTSYVLPAGAVETPGTYRTSAPYSQGTLIVGPLVTTPEPSAFALLLVGFFFLAFFSVRKRQLITT